MPTYDYKCKSCKHAWELFQPMTAAHVKKCPACGKSTAERQFGMGAAILFKGSGFYQTDYRSESYKKGADADKPAEAKAEGATESKVESKSDGKSEAKAEAKAGGKSDSKPEPKSESRPESKSQSQSKSEPKSKADAKVEGKPSPKASGDKPSKGDDKQEAARK